MEVSRPNSSTFTKSVVYRGPISWNQLRPELRRIGKKNVFVIALEINFGKSIIDTKLYNIKLLKLDYLSTIRNTAPSSNIVHITLYIYIYHSINDVNTVASGHNFTSGLDRVV